MAMNLDNLEVQHNPDEKRFELHLGAAVAFVEYMLAGNNIIFTHTEVPEAFEGQGVGNKLAKHVLDYAVEHGHKIQPLCPFINAYVHRHKEYHAHTWNM